MSEMSVPGLTQGLATQEPQQARKNVLEVGGGGFSVFRSKLKSFSSILLEYFTQPGWSNFKYTLLGRVQGKGQEVVEVN